MLDFEHGKALQGRDVRLFPAAHISSDSEAEVRAVSALLAIVKGVTPFGRAIVKLAGGPAGKISCYTEVCFPPFEPEGPRPRPDGIIRSVRGKQEWKALVEVKIGDNPLEQAQFDTYQRLAREHDFDAVITVSSQSAQADGLPPLTVDGRRLRAMAVIHLSWDRLLSEARMLAQQQGVEDEDQHWMLTEWIRYVTDPESRIIEPPQLGAHWMAVIKAAREANLPSIARYVDDLVQSWDGFLRKDALRLRALLGVEVQVKTSLRERQDPALRSKRMHDEVLNPGRLTGEIRIPDAVSDVSIELILQAQVVRFGIDVAAPVEGRQQTRVNWIARQLRDDRTPQDLVVKVDWDRKGLLSQAKAADVIKDSACLFRDGHNQLVPSDAMPRRFLLEWTRPLQKCRGKSTAPVLQGISADLETFYGSVVERLVAYVAPAPKLPKDAPADVQPIPVNEPAAPPGHLGLASTNESTPELTIPASGDAPITPVDLPQG